MCIIIIIMMIMIFQLCSMIIIMMIMVISQVRTLQIFGTADTALSVGAAKLGNAYLRFSCFNVN